MTVTGIIAEYNPLHTGHRYLLDQAEGLKIIAMSGNFVQRGEPALIDKWTRTQMVLDAGADLVVELPFLVAVQSADYFAQGAVAILERLGVRQLTFGTEEVLDYQALAQVYAQKAKAMAAYMASLPSELSYPQKTAQAWRKFAGLTFTGDTPNHILALAYAKATAHTVIKLNPIKRQGAGFHDEGQTSTYASATAIRKHIADQAFVDKFVPSAQCLHACPQVSWDNYFDLVRYKIITTQDLTKIFQVNEEMASRLKKAIMTSRTVEELVSQVATKRYTKARVRRLLTYILVNARETPVPKAVHVLGFSEKGQKHLTKLKGQVNFLTRIGKTPWDTMTQQADSVYRLGHPDIKEQTYGRVPIREN